MSGVSYTPILNGMGELQATLAAIPERVQNRVFRLAGRKAGKAVAAQAAKNTPRRVYPPDFHGPFQHLADRFISVQRVYRASNTTVNVVGGQSGGHNRINHFVERGTTQRFTNSKTRTVVTGTKTIVRSRPVPRAGGGWRTIKERVTVNVRKSTGSQATGNGLRLNRGVMPAFHQLKKASQEVPVQQILMDEIRKGLQRIADKYSAN